MLEIAVSLNIGDTFIRCSPTLINQFETDGRQATRVALLCLLPSFARSDVLLMGLSLSAFPCYRLGMNFSQSVTGMVSIG